MSKYLLLFNTRKKQFPNPPHPIIHVDRGSADKLGEEFTYNVPKVHFSRQKVTAFVRGKKIVWDVVEAHLGFVNNKREWQGTRIFFDLSNKGDKTELRFTHAGLEPAFECYKDCSNAWSLLIHRNFKNQIATGEPQPSPW